MVRSAAGQPVCAYIEGVNGTSQSDVELERVRRANEIHRSTQLTNCPPYPPPFGGSPLLSLPIVTFLLASVESSPMGARKRRRAASNEGSFHRKPRSRFRSLYLLHSFNARPPPSAQFPRALEAIHLTGATSTFIGHWVCVSMAFEPS